MPQSNPANSPSDPSSKTGASPKKATLINKINLWLINKQKISSAEKLFFIQHLGVMIKSGVSLAVALKTLATQTTNKKMALILVDIQKTVERGGTLTQGLSEHLDVFGEMFVNMVEAGEVSGNLETVLKRLYIQTKKDYELVSKVKGALIYPAVLLSAMVGIGIFMIVFVIPKITGIFKELNAELPFMTRVLIKISDTLVEHGIISVIIAAIIIFSFVKIIKTKKGKRGWHYLLLKTPVISPIIKKINLARFARTLSSLLKTDIPIIKTFQITSNVLGNVLYKEVVNQSVEKIKKGIRMDEILKDYPFLFPPVVTQMVSVGEETGSLDEILEELAGFYEEEIHQTMTNLPSLIEPLLMIILGVAVGGMAVAIIMPMYSLTQQF